MNGPNFFCRGPGWELIRGDGRMIYRVTRTFCMTMCSLEILSSLKRCLVPSMQGYYSMKRLKTCEPTALHRSTPTEVTKVTEKVVSSDSNRQPSFHSYAYITEDFAAGGLWERVEEFDNEQLRWAFSLPITEREGTNQLYFFHPGKGYKEGDPRHQSPYAEVLYHQNVIISLYPVPEGDIHTIKGVLPKGNWQQQPNALFGLVDHVYFAVFLSHSYTVEERRGYLEVSFNDLSGGVTIEAVSATKAVEMGIETLDEFAIAMGSKAPEHLFLDEKTLQANYNNLSGDQLQLITRVNAASKATINGSLVSFEKYKV